MEYFISVKNLILSVEYQLTVKNDLKVANLTTQVMVQNQNNFSSS